MHRPTHRCLITLAALCALCLLCACEKAKDSPSTPSNDASSTSGSTDATAQGDDNTSGSTSGAPNAPYPCVAADPPSERVTHDRLAISFLIPPGFEPEVPEAGPDVFYKRDITLSRLPDGASNAVGRERTYAIRVSSLKIPFKMVNPTETLPYVYGTGFGADRTSELMLHAGEVDINGQKVPFFRYASEASAYLSLAIPADGDNFFNVEIRVNLMIKTPYIGSDDAACPREFDDLAFAIVRSIQLK
jgi:hypothetical protein